MSAFPSRSDERNYRSGFPFAYQRFRVHSWPKMTVYIRAKKILESATKIMTISDAKIINFLLSESSFINCVGCQIKIERWSSGDKEETMNASKPSSSSRPPDVSQGVEKSSLTALLLSLYGLDYL